MTSRERAEALTLAEVRDMERSGLEVRTERFGKGSGHLCSIRLRNGEVYARANGKGAGEAQIQAWTKAFERMENDRAIAARRGIAS